MYSSACRQVSDLASCYIDGELPPSDRARCDEHYKTCAPCRDYVKTMLQSIRVAKEALREPALIPESLIPESLIQRILASANCKNNKNDRREAC